MNNNHFYTSERSVQILISLLKQHGIKKVVASPGTTNLSLVASLQQDDWFEMYSSVDERSAAYIACGMATESGEPVVLTCTGATASRNYLPGLTEAYYRKLPVLAVTFAPDRNEIGHLVPQMLDRQIVPKDVVTLSEYVVVCRNRMDEWDCEVRINRAILALRGHGGGPAHLNMTRCYNPDFSVQELPLARKIDRVMPYDPWPDLPQGRIAVVVGAHRTFSLELTESVDRFCSLTGAVVFCDHTSGYRGRFRVGHALVGMQSYYFSPLFATDLLIHLGEISGDYPQQEKLGKGARIVWRVNEDGELRDPFHKLVKVFEMRERDFFDHYALMTKTKESNAYLEECREEYRKVLELIPDLPLSNLWIARQISQSLPQRSYLHLGILNSLRAWNVFEVDNSIESISNTGGFGIDGILSTLMGASLNTPDRLHFCALGDLAFFYDMNVMGNRHVGRNVRILLVNNGKGTEFRNYTHPGAAFGEDADWFIAAAGHYGNQSSELVRHYANDLGYEYLSARDKEEFDSRKERFLTPEMTDRPMLLEVFTNSDEESEALRLVNTAYVDTLLKARLFIKEVVKETVGIRAFQKIKKVLK